MVAIGLAGQGIGTGVVVTGVAPSPAAGVTAAAGNGVPALLAGAVEGAVDPALALCCKSDVTCS